MGVQQSIKNNISRIKTKNKMLLGFEGRNAVKGKVNVEWWSAERGDGLQNVGDLISPVSVDYAASSFGIENYESIDGKTKFLSAIGSVLGMGINDTVVWGSGLLNNRPSVLVRPQFKRLDVRAVRGPNTRRVLMERGYSCPKVYGDPAILMPDIYRPMIDRMQRNKIGLIRHFAAGELDCSEQAIHRINPLVRDYRTFIDEVCSCELVISSSLHGIILAEAYGIPAILMADGRRGFDLFKYEDWYLSTERKCPQPVESISEALERAGESSIPDLRDLKKGLMEVFPADLFQRPVDKR